MLCPRGEHASMHSLFFLMTTILVVAMSGIISCSSNTSPTDHVTITSINAYITERDIAVGIVPTQASTSSVTLSHSLHEKEGVTCTTCHHKHHNKERIKSCSYCHKGRAGAKIMHSFCIRCHDQRSDGPRRCDECHIDPKQSLTHNDITKLYQHTFAFTKDHHAVHEAADVACVTCHHDDRGDAKQKKRRCDECHTGHSKMRILHFFCKDCHNKQGGPTECAKCHRNVTLPYGNASDVILLEKTGHRLPRIRFNHKAHIERYDTECIDCHHLGSTQKCSACHKKKDMGNIVNIRGAFHQQCHECHRRTKGPQACMQCHHNK